MEKVLLSNREKSTLNDLYSEHKLNWNPNKGFLINLDELIEKIPKSIFESKRKIAKSKIKSFYNKKSNFRLFRAGYLNKKLIFLVQEVSKRRIHNSTKKEEFIQNNILIRITNKLIEITKKPRTIRNHLSEVSRRWIRELDTFVPEKNGKAVIKDIFKVEEEFDDIFIKGLHLYGVNIGKNIRLKVSSDEKESLTKKIRELKYGKEFILDKNLDNLNLNNLRQIQFCNQKKEARLNIVQINTKQYRLSWQHGSNKDLKEQISPRLSISSKGSSLIIDYKLDEERITDFFKENIIDFFKRRFIYNDLLIKYSKFIEIDSKENPKLKINNIYLELRKIAIKQKYKLEKIYLRSISKIFFPIKEPKSIEKYGLNSSNCFFRINKDNKIAQHFLLNQEFLSKNDIREFLDRYFIFHPMIALDYRKLENPYPFTINTGEFLTLLITKPEDAFNRLIKDKDFISKEEYNIYFENAKNHLARLELINPKLNSKQKGEYFESICFALLSRMLLIKKIGNRLNPDGKFLLGDEKVLYDAKNLKENSSQNNLLKSITKKNGHIKDIEYIRQGKVKKYLFIVKNLEETQFIEVKKAIESRVNCTVSCISINLLKKVVDYYCEDERKFSTNKLKKVLFSGNLKKDINKREVCNRL